MLPADFVSVLPGVRQVIDRGEPPGPFAGGFNPARAMPGRLARAMVGGIELENTLNEAL
jgi:hypothetical protein